MIGHDTYPPNPQHRPEIIQFLLKEFSHKTRWSANGLLRREIRDRMYPQTKSAGGLDYRTCLASRG